MRKTVEACFAGQPDKICDQIADAIVDEYLRRDPQSRVDLRVMGTHGLMMIGGEVDSQADFDLSACAKKVYAQIGYEDDLEVFVNVEAPSEEMGRVQNGVRDLVTVHGYATAETRELLPRPVVFAQTIARRIDDLRRTDPSFSWLRPDGKVQLVMERDRICGITLLASHTQEVETHMVKQSLLERVVTPLTGAEGVQIYVNSLGSFTTCGFEADSGMNGRKTSGDLYGGLIPHADVILSGRDPHRAERAGTYMARAAARYLVQEGLCQSAVVRVAYTIGRAEPIDIEVRGIGNKSRGSKMDLTNLVRQEFDFRPEAIVERLDLLRPIYQQSSVYGIFGRSGLPWEMLGQKAPVSFQAQEAPPAAVQTRAAFV